MVGWLLGAALASPGHSGAAHIGAEPVPAGQAWVGAGTMLLWDYEPSGLLGGLEAGGSLGKRAALHGMVGASVRRGWGISLSGRYNLLQRPGVRLAVTGQMAVFEAIDSGWGVETRLSPGLAIDTGGLHWRFDAAVPLFGLVSVNRYFGPSYFPFPLAGTLGVSWLPGSEGRHRVRLGLLDGISYHHRGHTIYADVGLLPLGSAGFAWFKVGVILGSRS